jgi:hypothetical protein
MSNLWVTPDELGATYANDQYAYEAIKIASQFLWALSGRKYDGIMTVTERYVVGEDINAPHMSLIDPVQTILGINLQNMRRRGRYNGSSLRLRGSPVRKIIAVRSFDGSIVDPSKYYLTNHSTLQAVIGAAWSPNNIEVTYSYGSPPPAAGKMAARVLAKAFIDLFNDNDTTLPARITSVARQGVTYTIIDAQDFLDNGRTGVYAVDLFLKSDNPSKALAKSKVFSPDLGRPRRSTPKPLVLPTSILDLVVNASKIGKLDINLAYINAAFLLDGTGWVPSLHISNYSNAVSKELGSTPIALSTIPVDDVKSVAGYSLTSNVVTVNTTAAHGFVTGDSVVLAGLSTTALNTTQQITEIPSATSFQFACVAVNISAVGAGGTATVTTVTRDKLTLTVSYSDVFPILAFVDPGTWDLYASRPSLSTPGLTDVVYITSGNLIINLGATASLVQVV